MRVAHLLIRLVIVSAVFTDSSFAQNDPALWDINCVYVTVALHPRDYFPVKPSILTVPKLAEQIETVLLNSGIISCADVNSPMVADIKKKLGSYSNVRIRQGGFPELRFDTDILLLPDANQFILRVQLSLAKKLPLGENSDYYVLADVWRNEPALRLVSKADLPGILTQTALEQVRAFIAAKAISKPFDVSRIDPAFGKSSVEFNTKPEKQQNDESNFVASKNSEVFHKPGCPFAQKIAPKNLVTYSNREEAIAAGKRPCKKCNP